MIPGPTPTEYKGTRFRSKSEAVFAYTLDCEGVTWFYEPEVGSTSHKWDFLVFWPNISPTFYYDKNSRMVYSGPDETRYISVLLEYKPTTPAKTYVDNLCAEVQRSGAKGLIHLIAYGNPWDTSGPCDYIDLPRGGRNAIAEEILGNFLIHMHDGKMFRFDLAQGSRP